MTLYSAVLFVHVLSALGVFAALCLEAVALLHLRRATTASEAQLWLEFAPGLTALTAASFLLLLLSGIFMTTQSSEWMLAWVRVALGALLLLGPLGAFTGRKMRAIRNACAANDRNGSDLIPRLRDPFLKFSMNIRIAVVLGIVLLMTAKPELRQSLGIVVSAVFLAFLATVFGGRDTESPIARAESR
jgi:zinc transporter ZupT